MSQEKNGEKRHQLESKVTLARGTSGIGKRGAPLDGDGALAPLTTDSLSL